MLHHHCIFRFRSCKQSGLSAAQLLLCSLWLSSTVKVFYWSTIVLFPLTFFNSLGLLLWQYCSVPLEFLLESGTSAAPPLLCSPWLSSKIQVFYCSTDTHFPLTFINHLCLLLCNCCNATFEFLQQSRYPLVPLQLWSHWPSWTIW